MKTVGLTLLSYNSTPRKI